MQNQENECDLPVPEGYDRWEVRGYGWNPGRQVKYAIFNQDGWKLYTLDYLPPAGSRSLCYAEAVKLAVPVVGHTYFTREGRQAVVKGNINNQLYKFHGRISQNGSQDTTLATWTEEGRYARGVRSDNDLVQDITPAEETINSTNNQDMKTAETLEITGFETIYRISDVPHDRLTFSVAGHGTFGLSGSTTATNLAARAMSEHVEMRREIDRLDSVLKSAGSDRDATLCRANRTEVDLRHAEQLAESNRRCYEDSQRLERDAALMRVRVLEQENSGKAMRIDQLEKELGELKARESVYVAGRDSRDLRITELTLQLNAAREQTDHQIQAKMRACKQREEAETARDRLSVEVSQWAPVRLWIGEHTDPKDPESYPVAALRLLKAGEEASKGRIWYRVIQWVNALQGADPAVSVVERTLELLAKGKEGQAELGRTTDELHQALAEKDELQTELRGCQAIQQQWNGVVDFVQNHPSVAGREGLSYATEALRLLNEGPCGPRWIPVMKKVRELVPGTLLADCPAKVLELLEEGRTAATDARRYYNELQLWEPVRRALVKHPKYRGTDHMQDFAQRIIASDIQLRASCLKIAEGLRNLPSE